MKLLKQLIAEQPEKVQEGYFSGDDFTRFKKIASNLEDQLEKMAPVLREDSNFQKMLERLGADMGLFKECVESFNKLYDSVHDLHMYTDISSRDEHDDSEK